MKRIFLIFCILTKCSLFTNAQSTITTTDPGGNVGIKTTTPGTLLEIAHNGGSTYGTTLQIKTTANPDGPRVAFETYNSGVPKRWNLGIRNAATAFGLYEDGFTGAFGTERFTLLAGGNVGIGNTNPSAKLHIGAALSGQAGVTLGNVGDTGTLSVPFGASTGGYNIDFQGYRDIAPNQIGARIRGERINSWGTTALLQSMDLAFYTSTGGDASKLTEKVRIKSSGDVIIGTALARGKLGVGISPTSVLHVATTGNTGDDAYIQIQRRDANAGTIGLALQPSGTLSNTNKSWGYGVWGNTNDLRVWNYNGVANNIVFSILSSSGNVGIGTSAPQQKLHVAGNIHAAGKMIIGTGVDYNKVTNYALAVNGTAIAEKIIVRTYTNWPDYVFSSTYKLRSLNSLEAFINKNNHLPDVPSAEEVEKRGLDIGSTQAALLRKIEELTLYVLQQAKELKALKKEMASLKSNKQ